MGERISIPAACLEALGGLQTDDPWVVWFRSGPAPVYHGWGPLRGRPVWHGMARPERARILLPQSAPALLRVLARHKGLHTWPTNTPGFLQVPVQRTTVTIGGGQPSKLVMANYPRPVEWIEGVDYPKGTLGLSAIIAEVFVREARAHATQGFLNPELHPAADWTVEVSPC